MSFYDISGSGYVQNMEAKQAQYASLIARAEEMREEKGGPSKKEGELYNSAAAVCGEIMAMNQSQRAVRARWQQRKEECEEKVEEIVRALNPAKAAAIDAYREAQMDPGFVPAAAPARTAKATQTAEQPAGQPVRTKSGFTTKNAVRDVPANVIESWYGEMPNHSLEDLTGMDEQKKRLLRDIAEMGWEKTDKALRINPVAGYVFYGPFGSGKTYLVEAFARELMEKGFRYIRLLGGDIHASLVGVAEKTVQIAFQEAIDNAPCIIFIDELEGVCVDRENPKAEAHEKRLTVAFLEAWNRLKEYGKNIVFIGATNYPDMVDGAMMDRITLIKAPLPSEVEREAFFARNFGCFRLGEGLTYADMVDATDNFSYRDLDRVASAVNRVIKGDVIEANRVVDENGVLNQPETDDAASREILSGSVELSRELFFRIVKENLPADKTGVRQRLEAFEARRTGGSF